MVKSRSKHPFFGPKKGMENKASSSMSYVPKKGMENKASSSMSYMYRRSNIHIDVSRKVMEDMYENIGRHRPERGGFLFGAYNASGNKVVISGFVLDKNGRTSSASYYPSEAATSIIRSFSDENMKSFVGLVHSHPRGLDRPSGPDMDAMNIMLEINRDMLFAVVPIITHDNVVRNHEKLLSLHGGAKISFFIKTRDTGELCIPNNITFSEWDGISVCAVRDIRHVMSELNLGELAEDSTILTKLFGQQVTMISAKMSEKMVDFVFYPSYPASCPTVIVQTFPDKQMQEIQKYTWSMDKDSKDNMLNLVKNCVLMD